MVDAIITTKRNKTIIAPTYTIIKEKAKNSTSINNNKAAENKKTETKLSAEWIGLRTLTVEKAKKTMANKIKYLK